MAASWGTKRSSAKAGSGDTVYFVVGMRSPGYLSSGPSFPFTLRYGKALIGSLAMWDLGCITDEETLAPRSRSSRQESFIELNSAMSLNSREDFRLP